MITLPINRHIGHNNLSRHDANADAVSLPKTQIAAARLRRLGLCKKVAHTWRQIQAVRKPGTAVTLAQLKLNQAKSIHTYLLNLSTKGTERMQYDRRPMFCTSPAAGAFIPGLVHTTDDLRVNVLLNLSFRLVLQWQLLDYTHMPCSTLHA